MNRETNPEGYSAERLTIDDIASALGVSKTTVSRAISGKGRIGEDTRRRVLEYAQEHHYSPSPIAKGLAKSKTYNICWAVPGDLSMTDLPFFQRCMLGIGEVAAAKEYDLLVSLVYDNDLSQLKRVVNHHKVDGVILGRTLVEDDRIAFLKGSGIPYVVIGSSPVKGVIQIDNDHIAACRELTSILLMEGVRRPALIGGSSGHMVNQTRRKGFQKGVEERGAAVSGTWIYMDNESEGEVERALEDALRKEADCIFCMDDRICDTVLCTLRRDGIAVPGQVRVASFYNSVLLEHYQPAVTTLHYDPRELGETACRVLFDRMAGKQVEEKTLLGYEVLLKASTQ